MSAQELILKDNDSGHVIVLKFGKDILTGDLTFNLPEESGTLLLSSTLEDLKTKLADGTIVVKSASNIGELKESDIAKVDLSNVDIEKIPQEILDALGSGSSIVTSTELKLSLETLAGYKRNGKDVYQVEIDLGALKNKGYTVADIPNYNPEYKYWIDVSKSYIHNPTADVTLPFTYPADQYGYIQPAINKHTVQVWSQGDRTAYTDNRVVLNYTK